MSHETVSSVFDNLIKPIRWSAGGSPSPYLLIMLCLLDFTIIMRCDRIAVMKTATDSGTARARS